MMKKIMLIMVAGLVIVGGIKLHNDNDTISDEELVEMYFAEEHCEGDYEIEVYDDGEDKYIEYIAYQNGEASIGGSINKDYYLSRYTK